MQLPLVPGTYSFNVIGAALSDDPAILPCAPIGAPPEGTEVTAPMPVSFDGQLWRAKGTGNDTLALTLEGTGVHGQYSVAGTIQGSASDHTDSVHTATGVVVSFGTTPVPFTGETVVTGSLTGGSVTSTITFTDAKNIVGTCPYVEWILEVRH